MGIILSRFRRKKSTDEILEEIQNDIKELEENRDQTLQRQKYWIGRLYIYSIVAYVLIAAVFYFCFFPVSLADRIFYIIPLLGFPLIVILLKKFITWYYKREISLGKEKLSDLKAKKKKILDDVMNKETYKIAKEILEKYAPEQIKKTSETPPKRTNLSAASMSSLQKPIGGSHVLSTQAGSGGRPALGPPPPPAQTPAKPPGGQSMLLQRQPSPQRHLVRPIIPRERNLIDRLIESIVGDGPSNRYALICRNCASHNGMALKEEFEYLAFRCAYCGFPNPAHKVRPRPSVHRERESSEDRKSIEGGAPSSSTKTEGGTDDERSVSDTERRASEPTLRQAPTGKTVEAGLEGEQGGDDATLQSTEQPLTGSSSDEASAGSDGVRPRKPLHLPDD